MGTLRFYHGEEKSTYEDEDRIVDFLWSQEHMMCGCGGERFLSFFMNNMNPQIILSYRRELADNGYDVEGLTDIEIGQISYVAVHIGTWLWEDKGELAVYIDALNHGFNDDWPRDSNNCQQN